LLIVLSRCFFRHLALFKVVENFCRAPAEVGREVFIACGTTKVIFYDLINAVSALARAAVRPCHSAWHRASFQKERYANIILLLFEERQLFCMDFFENRNILKEESGGVVYRIPCIYIESSQLKEGRLIKVSGALAGPICCRRFRVEVDNCLRQGERHLIIDLAGVNYVDSAGLKELQTALRITVSCGGTLELARLPNRIKAMLHTLRMLIYFDPNPKFAGPLQAL
jgi:anti-anti-sigma regulatory factor